MTWKKTWLAMAAVGCMTGLAVAAAPMQDDEEWEGAYGAPEQLSVLAYMAGDWDVSMVFTEGEQEFRIECTASVHEILEGASLLEEIEFDYEGQTGSMATAFTFDRIREVYRVARIDSMSGMMDIYEGNFEDDALVLTNVRCGTSRPNHTDGSASFTRMTLTRISEASFEVVYEHSTDDGETWETAGTMVYTRRA